MAVVRDSEAELFSRLIEENRLYGLNLAVRHVRNKASAEELVQEAAVRCWKRWSSYDKRRPFVHWYSTVLMRVIIDYVRRRKLVSFLSIETHGGTGLAGVLYGGPEPEHETLKSYEAQVINSALESLSEEYSSALRAVYFDGMKYEEAAVATGCPVGTIRSRLARGKKQLREALEGRV